MFYLKKKIIFSFESELSFSNFESANDESDFNFYISILKLLIWLFNLSIFFVKFLSSYNFYRSSFNFLQLKFHNFYFHMNFDEKCVSFVNMNFHCTISKIKFFIDICFQFCFEFNDDLARKIKFIENNLILILLIEILFVEKFFANDCDMFIRNFKFKYFRIIDNFVFASIHFKFLIFLLFKIMKKNSESLLIEFEWMLKLNLIKLRNNKNIKFEKNWKLNCIE